MLCTVFERLEQLGPSIISQGKDFFIRGLSVFPLHLMFPLKKKTKQKPIYVLHTESSTVLRDVIHADFLENSMRLALFCLLPFPVCTWFSMLLGEGHGIDTSSGGLPNVPPFQLLTGDNALLSFETRERGFGISAAQTAHVVGYNGRSITQEVLIT